MTHETIRYRFHHADGHVGELSLEFEQESFLLRKPARQSLPIWTRLDFCRCPNCPLSSATHATCPAAEALVPFVELAGEQISHDPVRVEIELRDRTITKQTTLQRAYSSLLGLFLATSGCPRIDTFRPMARFHTPLASEEETLFRATSTHLLQQYLRREKGDDVPVDLSGLLENYRELQKVNIAMAKRLRAASGADAAPNAVVLLDTLAHGVAFTIADGLRQLRALFEPCVGVKDDEGARPKSG